MSIEVFRKETNQTRVILNVGNDSVQSVGLMREDVLNLNFLAVSPISFQIGDFCYFDSALYQINRLPKRKRLSNRKIQYVLQMEGQLYELGKAQFFQLDASNNFTEAIFQMRGKLRDFADLIIYNLKRVFPLAQWKIGKIEDTDFKDLDFSKQNCLQAIQTIADAFGTEYKVTDFTIDLFVDQPASAITLEYGKALLDLDEDFQDTSNIITRLYAYGSNKNITSAYRGGAQRLRMGDQTYLEKNVKLYKLYEKTVVFDGSDGLDEIYPHRTGTVTQVDDPFNFYDTGIDFDLNSNAVKIPGVTVKVTFNSGLLSGYTFEVAAYDNNAKKITINKNLQEKTIDVPSDNYKPVVGDTYVITDIYMPQSYITKAESDLKAAAQNYLDKYSVPLQVYSGTCNPFYFKANNINLVIGQTAAVKDEEMGIYTTKRIVAFTRKINNKFDCTVTLSDTVPPKSIIVKLIDGL